MDIQQNKFVFILIALAAVIFGTILYVYSNKEMTMTSEMFATSISFGIGCGVVWYLYAHGDKPQKQAVLGEFD